MPAACVVSSGKICNFFCRVGMIFYNLKKNGSLSLSILHVTLLVKRFIYSLCPTVGLPLSKHYNCRFHMNWAASSEFGTYRLCEQRRFRRACASVQSRQNLRYSLIQAVSQEEPSDRKPDHWPLWMAGHAQLKFVMTECSKTQIRLTRSNWDLLFLYNHFFVSIFTGPKARGHPTNRLPHARQWLYDQESPEGMVTRKGFPRSVYSSTQRAWTVSQKPYQCRCHVCSYHEESENGLAVDKSFYSKFVNFCSWCMFLTSFFSENICF